MKILKALIVIINILVFVWGIILAKADHKMELYYHSIVKAEKEIERLENKFIDKELDSNMVGLKLDHMKGQINNLHSANSKEVKKLYSQIDQQQTFNRLVAFLLFINAMFVISTINQKQKNNT